MSDILITYCTCENDEQAEKLAKALISKKVAACVNIFPKIRSIYKWENQLVDEQEVLLLIKTTQSNYQGVETIIKQLHTYDVPEIIAVPVAQAFDPYAAWVKDNVQ